MYTPNDRLRLQHHRLMSDLAALPLRERQANRANFADHMENDPDLIATRVEWMIGGDYGEGPYLICADILKRTRMNRVAILSQMIGGLEWNCSALEARKAYLSLDAPAQARINDAIQAVIDEATSAQGVTS